MRYALESRYFFVINPEAANGKTRATWNRLRRLLPLNAEHRLTESSSQGSRVTAEALAAGYDTIVAVGGDGTVNSVLNGFYRGGKMINPRASLAYMPSGTGKDLARTLDLARFASDEALLKLSAYRVSTLDHGLVRFRGHDGQKAYRYFVNEASVGFSADTVAVVNRSSKALGGKFSFFAGVFRSLARLKNHPIRVEVDGSLWFVGQAFLVAIANGRYFGGSMQIAPLAKPDDGLFDIVLITALTRREVLRHIGKIYSGKHISLSQVRSIRGRNVRITSQEQVPLELDGEQPGTLEAEFTMIGGGIRFLLP